MPLVSTLKNSFDEFFLINEKNLKIFLFNKNLPLKSVSEEEIRFSNKLNKNRKKEFLHSRCYTRIALSRIFDEHPLSISLYSPPGLPPILPKELGSISFSHCFDLLVVGWSRHNIGVDVERVDRKISFDLISKKIFTNREIIFLSKIKNDQLKKSVLLEYWVIKESLIKRERKKLLSNLKKWEWDYGTTSAFNLSNKITYKVKNIIYKDWVIGISNENLT